MFFKALLYVRVMFWVQAPVVTFFVYIIGFFSKFFLLSFFQDCFRPVTYFSFLNNLQKDQFTVYYDLSPQPDRGDHVLTILISSN